MSTDFGTALEVPYAYHDMDMWLVSDTQNPFQSLCTLQQLQLQKKGYLLFIQLLKQLHPHLQFKWDENTQSIPNNQAPTI